jgi:UDP-glucose 4-epimerase
MRVLVTGGAGYIGASAVSLLLAEGYEVTILDDLSTGKKENIDPRARFVQGSLLEKGACHQALSEVEAVIHFAAKSLVGESVEKPDLYWRNNLMGTRMLLDQMREFKVKKLVISSTAATYGEPTEVPISENSQTNPGNPYGASKLAVDLMVRGEVEAFNLGAISLRYFNVAGAHQGVNGFIPELHSPETHLIPNLLTATNAKPMKVFGTDWPTPDGTCVRDYVHVSDLVAAHILAMNNLVAGKHEIINLGSGSGYSVREVITATSKVLGRAVPTIDAPRRAGDPAVLVADISKAKSLLGWEPKADINQMVQDAWNGLKGAGIIK